MKVYLLSLCGWMLLSISTPVLARQWWKYTYIYIYIFFLVLFLLIQLLFVGSIFHLALFVLRLASWFYILSSFFCLTFHLSKDWIVLVGFWFSSLNWMKMLYKAFPSSMTWTSMPKFFPCFTQENLLTLHLYVQRIYSSWIF